MKLDIEYNEQWFLHVPFPRGDGGGDEASRWARSAIDQFNRADGWVDPQFSDELAATVLEQSTLFTTDVSAGFLYCPRGLPATAVIEVVLAPAEGFGRLAALDLIPLDETALPRQVVDVTASHLGDGVLVHGVAIAGAEDQLVGIACYSFVSAGCHVMVTVTTSDLDAIALGRPHFDEFVEGIEVVS